MIKWPDFILAPINLWNRPLQEIDYMKKEVDDCKIIANKAKLRAEQSKTYQEFCESIAEIPEKRLKHLKNLYYLRTGKLL